MKRALLLFLIVACGPPLERHHYTLLANQPATRFPQPLPIKLRVRDLDMRRSYRREEIVARSDAHELTYMRSRRWSEPPQRMISALVREQLRRSGLVAEIQEDSSVTDPDYLLVGEIEAIEQLNVGHERFGHIAMSYRLVRWKDDTTVWTYHIDAKKPVEGASIRFTVRTLSDVLAEETDNVIADLGRFLVDPTAPRPAASQPAATPEEAEGVIGPDADAAVASLPQVQRDDTPVPVGMGALFAPSLSDGGREPSVGVYADGTRVAEGPLGQRIVVLPGEYELRVGSGTVNQQLVIKVRVVDGKTTVVPPTWASLDISVVDETFLPFRGTYELIRMSDRDEFGLGLGADEQLAEMTRVWVLGAGLYKIIRAGGTYRDRTNFATVRVEAGKLTRFTLVLDKDDGSFRGAGENDSFVADPTTNEEDAPSLWQPRAVLGGDLNFNRSEEVGAPEGWKLSFRVFFDGSLRYAKGPHGWLTRLELEEGQTRLLAKDQFQNDTDRLYFHTIYTYQLLSWFGPYARLGLETKLLPRYQDFEQPRDVAIVDHNGQTIETQMGTTRVELGSVFAPLQLKEGIGGNFRVLRSTYLELNVRVGFGARHTIANGLYVYEDGPDGTGRMIPVDDANLVGPELTLVGLGRLTRYITLTTELDGLVPIGNDGGVVYSWRNQVALRLISFISLNYRFNITHDPNLGIGNDARTEHDLQLRFSYVLF